VDQEIEDVVIRMARENRSWGYDRIQCVLKYPGYTISAQTVGHILKRHGISPAPERKKPVTWGEFIRPHWDVSLATDFFNSEAWSWLGLIASYLLWFVHFVHRRSYSVVILLQHHMQRLKSHVIRFFDLRTHVYRWMSGSRSAYHFG
jgi:hypothetical protein